MCHKNIDPPGFALESFDSIGGWRDFYRTTGLGTEVIMDGRRMPYLQGKKVDPADVTAEGERFENIDGLKQILLKDKARLTRSLTTKLITYATGRAPQASDRVTIDAIADKIVAEKSGLRSLVHQIVLSELFQHK